MFSAGFIQWTLSEWTNAERFELCQTLLLFSKTSKLRKPGSNKCPIRFFAHSIGAADRDPSIASCNGHWLQSALTLLSWGWLHEHCSRVLVVATAFSEPPRLFFFFFPQWSAKLFIGSFWRREWELELERLLCDACWERRIFANNNNNNNSANLLVEFQWLLAGLFIWV